MIDEISRGVSDGGEYLSDKLDGDRRQEVEGLGSRTEICLATHLQRRISTFGISTEIRCTPKMVVNSVGGLQKTQHGRRGGRI